MKNQKELRSFLGAMNFYRRHVKNFTFSSAPLTELLKKNVKWRWTEIEQKCFDELKNKISALEVLGVPKPNGEIVMVTDSSDLGGGATLFQWQTLDPLENSRKILHTRCEPRRDIQKQLPRKFSVGPDWTLELEVERGKAKISLMGTGNFEWCTHIGLPNQVGLKPPRGMVYRQ